ncbi:unnamed protein product [Clonostachys rosea f. rosea IK726]|uniref:Nucleotide-diphospho-sugar transferase domain-containing protein n=2 Tax=Bionectria ochroleuca TaxID=29856 RepID=A0A0B7JMF0_BIOOC|nr:unnamed protein product [Clonostachys rosea f. rosea IK726]
MKLGTQSRHPNRPTFVLVAVIVFLSTVVGLTYTNYSDSIRLTPSTHLQKPLDKSVLKGTKEERDALRQEFIEKTLSSHMKVDSPDYNANGEFESKLSTDPRWSKAMGNNLCIIDLDNRPFTDPYQIFGPKLMSWDHQKEVHGLSVGFLNHWLYAKIHGYKYYYVQVDSFKDRRASWKKPSVISEILKNHETCIYLDSDAIFDRLDLPFEWLMNYWDIHPKTNSLAMASDPDLSHNRDKFGKLYLNTGFIVAQNNKKTYEILKAWDVCPDDGGEHPGCTRWRVNIPGSPTDQGGFGNFIRYDYAGDIKELPCSEANGFPQSRTNCQGKFIKHLWTGKDRGMKFFVEKQIPGNLLELFHEQFSDEKSSFFLEEKLLMAGSGQGKRTRSASYRA